MHRSIHLIALGAAALGTLVLGTPSARAQAPTESAPAETGSGPVLALHQQLVGLISPLGAEHRLDLSVHEDLAPGSDELLLDDTYVEVGASSAISPVYAFVGGYVQVSPLAFLVLRGGIEGASVWPIPLDGAGHFEVQGYDADVEATGLPQALGGTACGWTAYAAITLQGAIDLSSDVRLVMASELVAIHTELGAPGSFYYSMRHDLILAQRDLALLSSTLVAVDIRLAPDLIVRAGVYDDLRHVPASGYVGHQLGPTVALEWRGIDRHVPGLSVFLRGGGFTHHVIREGDPTLLGGVSIDYELTEL